MTANIAEGLGRGTQGEYERFLRIAAGSAAEVEVLVDLARDLEMTSAGEATAVRDEVRVLRGQLYYLANKIARERRS